MMGTIVGCSLMQILILSRHSLVKWMEELRETQNSESCLYSAHGPESRRKVIGSSKVSIPAPSGKRPDQQESAEKRRQQHSPNWLYLTRECRKLASVRQII